MLLMLMLLLLWNVSRKMVVLLITMLIIIIITITVIFHIVMRINISIIAIIDHAEGDRRVVVRKTLKRGTCRMSIMLQVDCSCWCGCCCRCADDGHQASSSGYSDRVVNEV